MLTISEIVNHLEHFITVNRISQDRLVYDLKCFRHRSNIRATSERLAALTVENDVVGDLLAWIQDQLNRDSLVDDESLYNQDIYTHDDGALKVFNDRVVLALDNKHCDVLV